MPTQQQINDTVVFNSVIGFMVAQISLAMGNIKAGAIKLRPGQVYHESKLTLSKVESVIINDNFKKVLPNLSANLQVKIDMTTLTGKYKDQTTNKTYYKHLMTRWRIPTNMLQSQPQNQQTTNAITAVRTYTTVCKMVADHINKNPHLASYSQTVLRVQELQINQYLSKKNSVSLHGFIQGLTSSNINITSAGLKPSTTNYMASIEVQWSSPAQNANPPSSASGQGAQLPAAQSPKGLKVTAVIANNKKPYMNTVEELLDWIAEGIARCGYIGKQCFRISSKQYNVLTQKRRNLVSGLEDRLSGKNIKIDGLILDPVKKSITAHWKNYGEEKTTSQANTLTPKEIYEQNKKRTNCIKCGTTTTPKMLLSSTVRYCEGCCG